MASRPQPQDTIRSTAYQAPIPPVEDAQPRQEPRYLKTEPMPGRPPFGGGFGPGFGARPSSAGRPVVLPRKSLLLAGALGLLLGPIGLLYSTFFGAFVMTGVFFWGLLFSGGQLAPALLGLSAVWGVWGAHRTNERRRAVEAFLSQA